MQTQEQKVRESFQLAKDIFDKKIAKGVTPEIIEQRRYYTFKKAIAFCEAGLLDWSDANASHCEIEKLEVIIAKKCLSIPRERKLTSPSLLRAYLNQP